MPGAAAVLRHELIGLSGVFERNVYLVTRYIWWDLAFFVWTIANTLTIVFIGEGVEATRRQHRRRPGDDQPARRRRRLGVPRHHLRDPHRDRRLGALGGDDRVHVHGAALAAGAPVRDGRCSPSSTGSSARSLLFGVVALFFDLDLADADFLAAIVVLLVASVSFIGIGMMTAVLPLISPEKGTQLGFMAQGILLVISGVYYPVSVLPEWMQFLSVVSPATYALDGLRRRDHRGRRAVADGRRALAARPDRSRHDPARALGLPARRDLREAARQAEAVGMIRRAETDADLAAYCDVWNAITPREPTRLEDVKRRLERQPERLYLVALEQEEVVGLGFCGPSQSPERTAVVVRVLPEHRRRGIGSELLDRVGAHAAQLERPQLSGMVFEDDPDSIAWVTNRRFEEYAPPGRAVARAFLGRSRAAGTGG